MVGNLDKLKAEKQLETLNLMITSQADQKSIEEYRSSLLERMGITRKLAPATSQEDIEKTLAMWDSM